MFSSEISQLSKICPLLFVRSHFSLLAMGNILGDYSTNILGIMIHKHNFTKSDIQEAIVGTYTKTNKYVGR